MKKLLLLLLLISPFTKCKSPFRSILPETNNGKWGRIINDDRMAYEGKYLDKRFSQLWSKVKMSKTKIIRILKGRNVENHSL